MRFLRYIVFRYYFVVLRSLSLRISSLAQVTCFIHQSVSTLALSLCISSFTTLFLSSSLSSRVLNFNVLEYWLMYFLLMYQSRGFDIPILYIGLLGSANLYYESITWLEYPVIHVSVCWIFFVVSLFSFSGGTVNCNK